MQTKQKLLFHAIISGKIQLRTSTSFSNRQQSCPVNIPFSHSHWLSFENYVQNRIKRLKTEENVYFLKGCFDLSQLLKTKPANVKR